MKNPSTFKHLLLKSLLLILLTINIAHARVLNNGYTSQDPFKVISYGEKIFFGKMDADVSWTITNFQENIIVNLKGNEINEYVFEKSGNYEISFLDNKKHAEGECNHSQFLEKIIVKVTDVKMVFDFSNIKFSQKIEKGRNCDNIIVTVPVNVKLKNNSSVKFVVPNLIVAGIGTDIIGKPVDQEINLKNGIQFLKYQLTGFANKETYLMFDFIDFNNQVQTYNQIEKIN